MLTVYILCCIYPEWGPVAPKTGFIEKLKALTGTFEMTTLFLLVMLGLYFGFFTPTEAGAAGSLFAVMISVAQGQLAWKGFVSSVMDTLRISCMVIMIVAGAVIFGRFLAVTRIPFDIASWVVGLPISNTAIMMIIFAIYIVGGAVMDALLLHWIRISLQRRSRPL